VSRPTVTLARRAGDEHQVLTVEGGASDEYRRRPCGGCPWRTDQTGAFPAEAFLHSAGTAYDMATHQFACHEAGADRPKTCAGYLLRGAEHNLSARLAVAHGKVDPDQVSDGGHELHDDYRSMAVANGCDPDDPHLRPCR
jgi:hypothetical protein